MTDSEYLEAVLLRHFFKVENEKTEMLDKEEKEMRSGIEFRKMYAEFEKKYNPYPVEMSRSEAFGKALNDGLIDQETYDEARKYYANLWNYVGD